MPFIMIVDDHVPILESLRFALRDRYSVLTFINGLDCLQGLNQVRPDVVLTDYKMDGLDGLELTKAIQQKHPDVPVILLASVLTPDLISAAGEAGVQSCLSKPFDLDELNRILSTMTEQRGKTAAQN
jgi:two-component system response regulator GlrR